MWIESSTFSPHRADARDFHVLEGEALLARHGIRADADDGICWYGVHFARSLPGGAVLPEVYRHHLDRVCTGLHELVEAGRLDGVLLDIHGAMSVVGLDDAEAHLVRAVREVVGQDAVLAAAMDLHGNVSRDLVDPRTSKLVPAEKAVAALLDAAAAGLDAYGDAELVASTVADVLEHGNGASRQRRAFTEGGIESRICGSLASTRDTASITLAPGCL